MSSLSHYEVLSVPTNATEDDIKRAFRKLALALHPDKNEYGVGLMSLVNEANRVLSDPIRRVAYDRSYRTAPENPRPNPPNPSRSNPFSRPGQANDRSYQQGPNSGWNQSNFNYSYASEQSRQSSSWDRNKSGDGWYNNTGAGGGESHQQQSHRWYYQSNFNQKPNYSESRQSQQDSSSWQNRNTDGKSKYKHTDEGNDENEEQQFHWRKQKSHNPKYNTSDERTSQRTKSSLNTKPKNQQAGTKCAKDVPKHKKACAATTNGYKERSICVRCGGKGSIKFSRDVSIRCAGCNGGTQMKVVKEKSTKCLKCSGSGIAVEALNCPSGTCNVCCGEGSLKGTWTKCKSCKGKGYGCKKCASKGMLGPL